MTFQLKENADGTIPWYKSQKDTLNLRILDFTETFTPVAKFTTVRTLVATAAIHGREIIQADISTAYLHAVVETELYMIQPQEFKQLGPNRQHLVCRLNKSIYGLKQAGRNWNKLLDKWMTSHGLVTGSSDPCLYTYKGTPEEHLMMVIYVDDILISSNSPSLRERLLREMGEFQTHHSWPSQMDSGHVGFLQTKWNHSNRSGEVPSGGP